jgi:cytochrome c oxidase subunit IV
MAQHTHDHAHGNHGDHGHGDHAHGDHGHEHAHPTPKTYGIVIFWLMVLLIITLAAAAVDLGAMNVVLALLIAFLKVAIIMAYFMHLKYSSALVKFFATATIFWVLIMFVITFGDYMTRGWMPQ